MRDVGGKACPDFWERFVFVPEEGKCGPVAVGCDVIRVKCRIFEAGIFKNEQVCVLCCGCGAKRCE